MQAVSELGELEVLITAMELEAVANTDSGRVYLRTLVSVSPEGQVNWLNVELRDGGMLGCIPQGRPLRGPRIPPFRSSRPTVVLLGIWAPRPLAGAWFMARASGCSLPHRPSGGYPAAARPAR